MNFYKLNSNEFEDVKKIEKITVSDYELLGDFIPTECLANIARDMLIEYENLKEEFEDYKQFVKDNYKQLTDEELVGNPANW